MGLTTSPIALHIHIFQKKAQNKMKGSIGHPNDRAAIYFKSYLIL